MDLGWIVTYAMVFVQLSAGAALLRSRHEPRLAVRILGVLFLVNAAVTALMTLPWYGPIYLKSDPGWTTKILRALDGPTGPLLLAFLAARSSWPSGRRVALGLVAFGFVQGLAELPFSAFLNHYDTYLRSLPYYAALGGGAYVLAAGRPWERWVALALLPRALYWGTAGLLDVVSGGPADELQVLINRVGLLALAAVAVAAAARLVRHDEGAGPHASVAVPVLLVGVGAALLEATVRASLPPEAFRYGSVLILNLLTLALVRPIVVVHGIAPDALGGLLRRTAGAAAVAAATGWIFGPVAFAGVTADPGVARTAEYGVGLLVGLLALATLEARRARPAPAAPAPLAVGPGAGPAAPGPADDGRPQWQTIVLALQGSCLPPDAPPQGEASLTQRALVERTGIRASRVSSVVRELNEGAAARLDAYAPGWRSAGHVPLQPEIVRQLRGSIPGLSGVWVYYRLTPLGERLADALAAAPPRVDRPGARPP